MNADGIERLAALIADIQQRQKAADGSAREQYDTLAAMYDTAMRRAQAAETRAEKAFPLVERAMSILSNGGAHGGSNFGRAGEAFTVLQEARAALRGEEAQP